MCYCRPKGSNSSNTHVFTEIFIYHMIIPDKKCNSCKAVFMINTDEIITVNRLQVIQVISLTVTDVLSDSFNEKSQIRKVAQCINLNMFSLSLWPCTKLYKYVVIAIHKKSASIRISTLKMFPSLPNSSTK